MSGVFPSLNIIRASRKYTMIYLGDRAIVNGRIIPVTSKRDKARATLIRMTTVREIYGESQGVTRFLFRLCRIYAIVAD